MPKKTKQKSRFKTAAYYQARGPRASSTRGVGISAITLGPLDPSFIDVYELARWDAENTGHAAFAGRAIDPEDAAAVLVAVPSVRAHLFYREVLALP